VVEKGEDVNRVQWTPEHAELPKWVWIRRVSKWKWSCDAHGQELSKRGEEAVSDQNRRGNSEERLESKRAKEQGGLLRLTS